MDKLIRAIVMEVRLRDGYDPTKPIPKGTAGNLELRIKGWINSEFGICSVSDLLDHNSLARHRSLGDAGYEGDMSEGFGY